MQGIYTVLERTNNLVYKVQKKGGALKYNDPENSEGYTETHLTHEEDEDTEEQPSPATIENKGIPTSQEQPQGCVTCRITHTLSSPIQRYTAITTLNHDAIQSRIVGCFGQALTIQLLRGKDNHPIEPNKSKFAEDFTHFFQLWPHNVQNCHQ